MPKGKEATVASNRTRILIVSADAETTAEATQHVVLHMDADVTVVDTLEQAGVVAASGAFDAILAAETLPDGDALSLLDLHRGSQGGATPFFILATTQNLERNLAALRSGAAEVFVRPLTTQQTVPVLRRAIQARREQTFRDNRNRRLRRLSARLIRDRREMRHRVDLICRDVVQAYRRLAEKTRQTQDLGAIIDPGRRANSLRRNP